MIERMMKPLDKGQRSRVKGAPHKREASSVTSQKDIDRFVFSHHRSHQPSSSPRALCSVGVCHHTSSVESYVYFSTRLLQTSENCRSSYRRTCFTRGRSPHPSLCFLLLMGSTGTGTGTVQVYRYSTRLSICPRTHTQLAIREQRKSYSL
jgi:hypothetical protein